MMKIIPLKCSACNKLFQQPLWKYNKQINQRNKHFFCSRKCYRNFLCRPENENKHLIPFSKKYTQKIREEAAELRVFGMSYLSISKQLEIPLGSVSYLLRRSKNGLE